jgi:transposase InsO family protein
MKVTRSCYYTYLKTKVDRERVGESAEALKVKECFGFHRRRYGSRRIAKELKLGRFLVRRLMREQGLKAIQPKSFVPRTTDSTHGRRISPNLLREIGEIKEAGQVIVGDITYLPLSNGKFCYLATFQDKDTRRIIGWAITAQMTAELVVKALAMALRRGLIAKNAIIHTDRGSQYVSNIYRELLKLHGLRQSMSGRGNCYDNAQADAFLWQIQSRISRRWSF